MSILSVQDGTRMGALYSEQYAAASKPRARQTSHRLRRHQPSFVIARAPSQFDHALLPRHSLCYSHCNFALYHSHWDAISRGTMERPTPLVQFSFGENPWTSERDMSLQEEDEDSPPRRWFDYFPVCGTPDFGPRTLATRLAHHLLQ